MTTLTNERMTKLLRCIQPYDVPADMEAVTKAAQDAWDAHGGVGAEASYQSVLAAVRKRHDLFGRCWKNPLSL